MVSVRASEKEEQVCLAVIAAGTRRDHEPCALLGSCPCPLSLPECILPGETERGVAALSMGSCDTYNIIVQYASWGCLGCEVGMCMGKLSVGLLEFMNYFLPLPDLS